MNNLVSIITVVYNREDTISRTIESVLNQTYSNIEYILIDGLSKDNTVEKIKSYKSIFNDKNIAYTWISEPDKGIYDAMNKGIKMAKGDIIGLINSDDWYELDAVESIISLYNCSLDFQVIYGKGNLVQINGILIKEGVFVSHDNLVKGKMLWHPGVFVSRKTYQKFGLFTTNYSVVSDYDLMLRFYYSGQVVFKPLQKNIFNQSESGTANLYILEFLSVYLKYKSYIPMNNIVKLIAMQLLRQLKNSIKKKFNFIQIRK